MSTTGYDEDFLEVVVPLPRPSADVEVAELIYTHFTVLQRTDRRLAALTAVNIDGAALLPDIDREGVNWRLDARLPKTQQCGNELYKNNDLDRGHLVRRRDPVWGSDSDGDQGNRDTFHYTNAAPQVAKFNQSKELWLGLEDYLLEHADNSDSKLTVFTAPILDPADPVYREVQIPRKFWKVAAWVSGEELACTGYLLDQTELLVGLLSRTVGEVPPLGAYRTFQVRVSELAAESGIAMDTLAAADRLVTHPEVAPTERRRALTDYSDIVL